MKKKRQLNGIPPVVPQEERPLGTPIPSKPGNKGTKTRKKVKKPRTDHKLPGNPLDFEDETLFY